MWGGTLVFLLVGWNSEQAQRVSVISPSFWPSANWEACPAFLLGENKGPRRGAWWALSWGTEAQPVQSHRKVSGESTQQPSCWFKAFKGEETLEAKVTDSGDRITGAET